MHVKRSKKVKDCPPTPKPGVPSFCNGNGNADDMCSLFITGCNGQTGPFTECIEGLTFSPFTVPCQSCPSGTQPVNTVIACTAANSGSCSETPGPPTNCDLGPNPERQGFCYCSSTPVDPNEPWI